MTSNGDIELNIKPFDMSKIKKNSIVVTIGKRNTGKSTLIKDILFHNKTIPLGMVVSRTDHLTHFYDTFIPGMFIHSRYQPETIDKLFKRQERAIDEMWNDPYAFLLFDDCLSDSRTWAKDERIKEIFFNGRHYKLLFILAMQAPMGIPPDFRTNIDFTFILKNNNASDREKIYKNYAGMFPNRVVFDHVLDECTDNYQCLVIDNTTKSNNLEDQVFIYKASTHENDFRIGSNSMWRVNNEQYNNKSNSSNNSHRKVFQNKGKGKLILTKK